MAFIAMAASSALPPEPRTSAPTRDAAACGHATAPCRVGFAISLPPLVPGRFNRANNVLDVRAKIDVSWDEVRAFAHAVPRGREYLVAARTKPTRPTDSRCAPGCAHRLRPLPPCVVRARHGQAPCLATSAAAAASIS